MLWYVMFYMVMKKYVYTCTGSDLCPRETEHGHSQQKFLESKILFLNKRRKKNYFSILRLSMFLRKKNTIILRLFYYY